MKISTYDSQLPLIYSRKIVLTWYNLYMYSLLSGLKLQKLIQVLIVWPSEYWMVALYACIQAHMFKSSCQHFK